MLLSGSGGGSEITWETYCRNSARTETPREHFVADVRELAEFFFLLFSLLQGVNCRLLLPSVAHDYNGSLVVVDCSTKQEKQQLRVGIPVGKRVFIWSPKG